MSEQALDVLWRPLAANKAAANALTQILDVLYPPKTVEEPQVVVPQQATIDHLDYCRDVLSGKIVAGKLIKAACQRTLDDHEEAETNSNFEYQYRQDFATPVLRFVEYCAHTKGQWARRQETIKLAPWQRWIVSELYGWRLREDNMVRRYTEGLLEIGRKNGKTTLAAPLTLYELRYGDAGAEVVSAATKQDQARIVWTAAADMVSLSQPGVVPGVIRKQAELRYKNCTFRPLSKTSRSLDGLNPSFFVVDEAAAIMDRSVIEIVTSGMGSRENAWTLYITTAQGNTSTLYFDKREYAKSFLLGDIGPDDSVFAALYELDEDDDIDRDHSCWIKANPNLGVSVLPRFLKSTVEGSRSRPAERNNVLTKHFNRWVSSAAVWIDGTAWRECQDEVVREGPCWIGTDLAQIRDLCAVARVWANSREKYSVDFMCWLPEAGLEHIPDRHMPVFEQAISDGTLTITTGPVMDYSVVEAYLRQSHKDYDVRLIGVDPWNAQDMVNRLEEERYPVLTVRQSMSHLSAPSKMLESHVLQQKIKHNGDSFVQWQFENCHAHRDMEHNIKIRQGPDQTRKIDAIKALIVAMACVDYNATTENDADRFTFVPFGKPDNNKNEASSRVSFH